MDKATVSLEFRVVFLLNARTEKNRFFQYIRTLKNFSMEQPYQHAVYYLTVLLTEHSWTKKELLAAADRKTKLTFSYRNF